MDYLWVLMMLSESNSVRPVVLAKVQLLVMMVPILMVMLQLVMMVLILMVMLQLVPMEKRWVQELVLQHSVSV